MDDDKSQTLTSSEFHDGIKCFGLEINDDEISQVFNEFDHDNSGSISIEEFIVKLRPPLSSGRLKLIDAAFKIMDTNGNGVITIEDLKGVYDIRKNPRYLNGDWTEEKCFLEFLKNFENPNQTDGIVTYEEFLDYYSVISASIDTDSYFNLMMRNSFKNLKTYFFLGNHSQLYSGSSEKDYDSYGACLYIIVIIVLYAVTMLLMIVAMMSDRKRTENKAIDGFITGGKKQKKKLKKEYLMENYMPMKTKEKIASQMPLINEDNGTDFIDF